MEPLTVIKPEWAGRRACCHCVLQMVTQAGNRNSVFFESDDGKSSTLTNVDTFGFGNEVNSATAAGEWILAA